MNKHETLREFAGRIAGHRVDGLDATYDRHDYLAEKREALGRLAQHLESLKCKL